MKGKHNVLARLQRDLDGLLQIFLLEPELLEAVRRSVVLREVEEALSGRLTLRKVESLGDARDGGGGVGSIVGNGVREDDGVGFGVGHAEGAAEGVALSNSDEK